MPWSMPWPASRRRRGRIALLAAALFLALPLGCAYQRSVGLSTPGMPEEIHQAPDAPHVAGTLKAAVFPFGAPAHMPDMGMLAAWQTWRALTTGKVFDEVTFERTASCDDEARLLSLAYSKGYQAMICGDVLYARDGGISMASRVDEQFRLLRVRGKVLRVVWSAGTVETVAPAPSHDAMAVRGEGMPAPSLAELARRNAEKFRNLLLEGP